MTPQTRRESRESQEQQQEEKGRKSLSGKDLKKVTVSTLSFPYRVEEEHPYEVDKVLAQDRNALRGEEIWVLPVDFERGTRLNAFLKPGQSIEAIQAGEGGSTALQFSAKDATDTELINWIKDSNPTEQEVVDASEGDPETASRLLSAESAATGNDPRKAVVAGLERVVERGEE